MALVNCSVVCKTDGKVLLPWCICSVGPDSGYTVKQFYDTHVIPELEKNYHVSDFDLTSASLGMSKELLDKNDL